MSVPYRGATLQLQQPDGSTLTVRASGHRHGAWFRTLDGRPLVPDPGAGTLRVAAGPRGAGAAPAGVQAPALRTPRWQERRDEQRAAALQQERSGGRAPPRRKTVGAFVGLCLPIDFPDQPATLPRDEIDAFCNRSGYAGFGNAGSVRDYFADVSQRRLDYTTVVAPYHTAAHPQSHYADVDVPWPQRAQELIEEALLAHRAAGLDVSALTADAQQAVYAINVLYAGTPAADWSKGLWPHASRLGTPLKLAPRKMALDYQISALGSGPTLGVYCHENGHMLCDFPDLYSYQDQAIGVGRYCLMCLGCNPDPRNPTQVGAYLRWRAGWADARPLTDGAQRLGAGELLLHPRPGSTTEYYLLELRRREGRDAMLGSSGLALWHVDELGSNAMPDEAPDGHRHAECVLLQADGRDDLGRGEDDGDAQDLFGPEPNPIFVDDTALSGRWWDGTPSGLQIHSIEDDGDALRFVAALD